MHENELLGKKLVVAPGKPLRGALGFDSEWRLPGDKSLSHRAALFAAMANGPSRVDNFLVSGVTQAMLDGLTALAVPWELDARTLSIQGMGMDGFLEEENVVHIDCDNSATTLRLLAGALAAWNLPAVLDGSPGLRRRPMKRIVEPLRQMGVIIQDTDGKAPLRLQPTRLPLRSIEYPLPIASAQVKSCLCLAALAAEGETALTEPGPSRDHTERMLRSMGVRVISERLYTPGISVGPSSDAGYITRITPADPQGLKPLHLTLPGDISAAAFLIVAGLITPGSEILLQGVGLNPTRTGLLDALTSMGADLQITNRSEQGDEPLGDLTIRYSRLEGVQVDGDLVVRMIDEFPVFAIAAAFAQGQTSVLDATELRHKESDRISALCGQLTRLGVDVEEKPDGFVIQGGKKLHGGVVDPHGDHRLAMSLAVAGLAAREQVTVDHADIIAESFPDFVPLLQGLGATLAFEE